MASLEPANVCSLNSLPLPQTLSGLWLWAAADQGAGTVDGAAVSPWSDLSGQGRHLTLQSGDTAPVWIQAGTNGLPIVRFADTTKVGLATALNQTLAAPYTVALVFAYQGPDIATGTGRAIQGSNNWLIGPYAGYVEHFAGNWVSETLPTYLTPHQFYVAVAVNTGALSHFYRDGTDYTSSPAPVGAPGRLCLSGSAAAAFPLEHLNGDIAEIVVYNRALSGTERASLETYLKGRWGTS